MSKWFVKYRYSDKANLRIFCFPYAGGSAAVFDGWQNFFREDIDVFSIQAPGREERYKERLIKSISEKVDVLLGEIAKFVDVPYIFISHSNGALTAFELARKLQMIDNFNLKHIFLSARRAPHLASFKKPVYNLPYAEFIEELKTFSTIPADIIDDPSVMEVFMPMLRADFELGATYKFDYGRKLLSNATLFWGEQDAEVSEHDMLAWQDHIVGQVNNVPFKGGHFFIHEEQASVISHVLKITEGLR